VRKPERKGLLQRPRWMWVDNIRVDLEETGWGGMNLIGMAQNNNKLWALVKLVMNFWDP
jgi:hypothetical protein